MACCTGRGVFVKLRSYVRCTLCVRGVSYRDVACTGSATAVGLSESANRQLIAHMRMFHTCTEACNRFTYALRWRLRAGHSRLELLALVPVPHAAQVSTLIQYSPYGLYGEVVINVGGCCVWHAAQVQPPAEHHVNKPEAPCIHMGCLTGSGIALLQAHDGPASERRYRHHPRLDQRVLRV